MSYKYAHDFVVQKQILTEINTQHLQNNNYITNQENSEPLSPIKINQPSTTQNFTGQQEYLKKLHMHMNKNDSPSRKMYLLYGVGGIGKTQITLKYIDESSDRIYIKPISNIAIWVSYSAAMIQQWMNTLNDEWLMIFDNADGSPDTVEKFIPPGNKGHILITSRNPEHKRVVSAIMNEETAVELLLKYCAKFHFLPLAIDQAGAYISTGQFYDKYRFKLMTNKKFKGSSKYNKTVYGTWEISFQKIEEMAKDDKMKKCNDSKYAIKLINMSAFLHHENISDEIFERAAKYYAHHIEKYKDIEYNEWNEMQYRESIGLLLSFSLIKRTVDGANLEISNIIYYDDIFNILLNNEMNEYHMELILRSRIFKVYEDTYGKNSTYMLSSMSELATAYRSHGKSTEAEVLEIQNSGKRAPRYTESMHNLAITLQNLGKWKEAEVLQIQHPHTLSAMNNLASTLQSLGKWTEAEVLQIQVLEMYTRILGKEHPGTLSIMNNLALTLQKMGKWTEAKVLHIQALEMRTRILGKEHPNTLISMNNLALTLQDMGKWTEAEVMQIKVLEMRTRILGKEHPDTLTAMNNLALTLQMGVHM
ncbi:P-loop containing nucleoside triphosphate hydrolase protein [Cyathus striatus]|nr:P-loop containing nucleoside triphosphate hydrolase protein [Cyathus striatus]